MNVIRKMRVDTVVMPLVLSPAAVAHLLGRAATSPPSIISQAAITAKPNGDPNV